MVLDAEKTHERGMKMKFTLPELKKLCKRTYWESCNCGYLCSCHYDAKAKLGMQAVGIILELIAEVERLEKKIKVITTKK